MNRGFKTCFLGDPILFDGALAVFGFVRTSCLSGFSPRREAAKEHLRQNPELAVEIEQRIRDSAGGHPAAAPGEGGVEA